MGFIISGGDRNFYYSGDTALHMDMQLIGQKNRIDVAFLCIGDNFTMGIDDAVSAAGLVRSDLVVGMHYDTFPFIRINHERAHKAFDDAGKQLILPSVGQTFEI
jgi:L-ascorbate metabolism protein UlaG (beta-lactamase superfamily)